MNVEEIINSEEFQKAIDKFNYACRSASKAWGNIGAVFISAFERQVKLWTALAPIFYSDFNCEPRVKHLARFSKKKRVRKKNNARMIKEDEGRARK